MSNGILQFTLGLATGGFLSKLGEAKAGITGFIGGLIGVGAIVEGVHKAIDKGAELERLHKQTGIASGTLFQLQEGFKAAGLGADEAGPLMLRMQRAIGGVNEMGESTSDIFRRMGLNIADLKKLDAPQQFQSILHAISRLDSSSAAMAAGSIFGRFGFGDIIQLTRSTKEFGAAMKRSAEDAKEWQRVSAAFEQFKISLNRIKEIAEGFFGGIAAGVVPALQKGLDYLESWESTITEIGQKIGEVIKDLVGSFQNGTFTDIVSLSFQIGFRNAELYAIRFIDTLASGLYTAITEGIGEAFRTAGKLAWEDLKVGLQLAEMDVMQHGYQADLNRKDGPPPDAQRAQEDRDQIARIEQAKNALVQGFIEHATELGKTVLSNLHTGLMSGWNAASQTWNDEAPGSDPELTLMKLRLNRLLEQAGMAFNLETSSNFKQGRGGNLDPVKSHYKFEGTQLEKMGFVMKGAGNPALDFARRTAIATEKMAAFLQGAPAPSSGAMGVNAV